jgi:cell division protein FtsB|tara:strand:- start:3671 stop:3841 length:171 start_codon:yes stop_codon:yes gene_type:complete
MEDGYTEYGYRGLAELKIKDQEIEKLKEEIGELQMRLQRMENHANDLQAKASLPRY